MPWWQKSSSSTSSSSPKSTIDSPHHIRNVNYFSKHRRGFHHSQPRLTRQRKLRHLDVDVRLNHPFTRSGSWTVSSPSPSSAGSDHIRSSLAAVPQPLPLPDSSLLARRDSGSSYSNSGRFPLPSPKEDARKGDGEESEKADSLIGEGEGVVSSSALGRRLAYPITHKNSEHLDTVLAKSPTGRGKKVLQGLNDVESGQNSFYSNFPTKSAPTSGLSSPVLSPRRMSTGDFSPSPYAHQGFQVWSDPEFPATDTRRGFSYQTSPEKAISSPDRSPLQSPRAKSPGLNLKSPSASPLHPQLSLENSALRHDSSGHVGHPLPRPPGATTPPSPLHQTIVKPEISYMTSQWQKGKLIGRGTFGSVYVASNRETGALCAMKEVDLIPDDPKSAECIKQLEQEIKVLSQLKHPNIVQYYGSEIVEDHFYIYLEYVHPGSINKYVHEHCGAITESVVRSFTRHILSGLAYLHSTKTIHRDIKGANLLVDSSGVVKLADFGMAKHLSGHAANLSMKGSPYWMAPEVIQAVLQKDSNSDLALAVDIWSLGCTIIEMLQGKPPWSEFEGAAAMFKVLRETPPIPETLSSAGKDFLQLCFRRNPAERPSASMLLEHRFLRNSHHPEVPAVTQAFSGMRVVDTTHSARELTRYKVDLLLSPGSQTSTKGQLPFNNGETTGQQSHHLETSDSAAGSRLSPRSTLEALPSSSPPHFNDRSIIHNNSNLSPTGFSSINLNSRNASPYALRSSLASPNGSSASFLKGVDHNYDRLILQRLS